jgi:hypothetical protein
MRGARDLRRGRDRAAPALLGAAVLLGGRREGSRGHAGRMAARLARAVLLGSATGGSEPQGPRRGGFGRPMFRKEPKTALAVLKNGMDPPEGGGRRLLSLRCPVRAGAASDSRPNVSTTPGRTAALRAVVAPKKPIDRVPWLRWRSHVRFDAPHAYASVSRARSEGSRFLPDTSRAAAARLDMADRAGFIRNPYQLADTDGTGGGRVAPRCHAAEMMGRVTVKVLPWPGLLSTVIVPWWASTMNFAMLRPRPQPSARRDRLRSTW